jgi:transcriptional regulator with XRE-family HTH domain
MKTFGTIIAEARRPKGLSQRELAAKVKKEDGQAISAQYLNDIEHDRRNPPNEYLIAQFAHELDLDKDVLCLAAGTIPQDVQKSRLRTLTGFSRRSELSERLSRNSDQMGPGQNGPLRQTAALFAGGTG